MECIVVFGQIRRRMFVKFRFFPSFTSVWHLCIKDILLEKTVHRFLIYRLEKILIPGPLSILPTATLWA